MPSSTSTTLSSSCFPEKPETPLGKLITTHSTPETLRVFLPGDEARNRFAISGSSFDSAGDVEHEFYADPDFRDSSEDGLDDFDEDSNVSRSDIRSSILSVDRFFASGIRTISESGSSLSAMSEEEDDEDEEDDHSVAATDSNSANIRGLVDRIFAGGCAPSRYKVASVPSLGAIEEEDESQLEDDDSQDPPLTDSSGSDSDGPASTASSTTELMHFDDIASSDFSLLCFSRDFSALARAERNPVNDLDSDWVLVEVGDGEAIEPGTVPLARFCEVRSSRAQPLSGLRGSCGDRQTWDWRWRRIVRKFLGFSL